MPITAQHAVTAGRLPLIHRDPFDRMLVAHVRILRLVQELRGSLVLVLRPGLVVDVDSLKARYTDVDLRPGGGPEAPVILRVRLAGRMRYGWIETRWP